MTEAAGRTLPEAKSWPRVLDGRLRTGFVLFGGMIVLQSSQALDLAKVTYFLGVPCASSVRWPGSGERATGWRSLSQSRGLRLRLPSQP